MMLKRNVSWITAAMLLVACGEPHGLGERATIAVRVAGLTGASSEIEVLVAAPERLWIDAEGTVRGGVAVIELEARREDGSGAGGSRIEIPAARAGAEEGDRGGGSASVLAEPGRVTEITLPFTWAGDAAHSGWNVSIDFSHAPDISWWTVTPIHGLRPGDAITISLGAKNHEGAPGELSASAALGSSVAPLTFDPATGTFSTRLVLPPVTGTLELSAIVVAPSGASTRAQKSILVAPVIDATTEVDRDGDGVVEAVCTAPEADGGCGSTLLNPDDDGDWDLSAGRDGVRAEEQGEEDAARDPGTPTNYRTLFTADELARAKSAPVDIHTCQPGIGICDMVGLLALMEMRSSEAAPDLSTLLFYSYRAGYLVLAPSEPSSATSLPDRYVDDLARDFGYNLYLDGPAAGQSPLERLRDRLRWGDAVMISYDTNTVTGDPIASSDYDSGLYEPGKQGHVAIVQGFIEKDGREYVIVKQPWDGADRVWLVEELVRSWDLHANEMWVMGDYVGG